MSCEQNENRTENQPLSSENEMPKKRVPGPPKLNGCILALIIGLCFMFGIVVISIVAAVALPMYSSFQAKVKLANVVKSIQLMEPVIVAHYLQYESLEGLEFPEHGGPIRYGDEVLDASLSSQTGLVWSATVSENEMSLIYKWENSRSESGFYTLQVYGDDFSSRLVDKDGKGIEFFKSAFSKEAP